MMKPLSWFIVLALAAAAVFLFIKNEPRQPSDAATEHASSAQENVREAIALSVFAFGERLRNVSLLSPSAPEDIEREYASFVTKNLRASWSAAPARAAGRETSSPWPERFEIAEIMSNPDGSYAVRALLVFMTSDTEERGGNAGTQSVEMTVRKEEGAWKIDTYEVIGTHAPNAPLGESDRPQLE